MVIKSSLLLIRAEFIDQTVSSESVPCFSSDSP